MYQLHRKNVDERISDFLARKTAPKNLSQIIADHLTSGHKSEDSPRDSYYELLPLHNNQSATH